MLVNLNFQFNLIIARLDKNHNLLFYAKWIYHWTSKISISNFEKSLPVHKYLKYIKNAQKITEYHARSWTNSLKK